MNLPFLDLSKPLLSSAKLNLFLSITGRRSDGYHDLETIFQFISLHDKILIEKNASNQIELIDLSNQIQLKDNLILKAIAVLKRAKPYHDHFGITITLDKKIPIGAGLGGGSSNCATTLIALNQLWNLNLTKMELMQIGKTLGADVPIFIYGQSAFAKGIGELLEPIELSEPCYLLIKPDCSISTAMIFNHFDLKRNSQKITQDQIANLKFYNDCEPLVRSLYPEINEMIEFLAQTHESRLTGTGSAFFAVCNSKNDAEHLLNRFKQYFSTQKYHHFIVQGLNKSSLF